MDNIYPRFAIGSITLAYLYYLLRPYHDAIVPIYHIDQLYQYINTVIPPRFSELLIKYFDDSDRHLQEKLMLEKMLNPELDEVTFILNHNKKSFLNFLGSLVVDHGTRIHGRLTPWTLTDYGYEDLLVTLFGPSTTEIPITVCVGSDIFVHRLNSELTYGLVYVLHDIIGYSIHIADTDTILNIENIKPFFPIDEAPYKVDIFNIEVEFETTDFIRGVITACNWIYRDYNTVITNLMQVDLIYGRYDTPLNIIF